MTQAETIPTTTRRSFLSTAVVAAVLLPAGALAQPTDPLLGIIESHRAALKEFAAASLACDEVDAERKGRVITQSMKEWLEAAADANEEAAELLASTAPVTIAELSAAVSWLLEYDKGCAPDTTIRFLRTVATSPLIVRG